eukprot:TRINITY_DN47904_c0_g1_i1.p1 TRINITY_DN47904_c0_g1~~TRINITY_DN47904_c0_g1_i1.p1  ORF type:complete len:127 (-),score=18.13 TRINITY_DN47904_c0_g1_i1:10-390(-)
MPGVWATVSPISDLYLSAASKVVPPNSSLNPRNFEFSKAPLSSFREVVISLSIYYVLCFILTRIFPHAPESKKSEANVKAQKKEKPQSGLLNSLFIIHNYILSFFSEIGRAVQQECRDRSRMPSSA